VKVIWQGAGEYMDIIIYLIIIEKFPSIKLMQIIVISLMAGKHILKDKL